MLYPLHGNVTVWPTSTICKTGDEIVTVIVGGLDDVGYSMPTK